MKSDMVILIRYFKTVLARPRLLQQWSLAIACDADKTTRRRGKLYETGGCCAACYKAIIIDLRSRKTASDARSACTEMLLLQLLQLLVVQGWRRDARMNSQWFINERLSNATVILRPSTRPKHLQLGVLLSRILSLVAPSSAPHHYLHRVLAAAAVHAWHCSLSVNLFRTIMCAQFHCHRLQSRNLSVLLVNHSKIETVRKDRPERSVAVRVFPQQ